MYHSLTISNSSAYVGTSIAVYCTIGAVQVDAQFVFDIDNIPISTFTPSGPQLGTRQVLALQSDTLSDGPHTLTISRLGGADPSLFLDYFLYNVTSLTDTNGMTMFYDDNYRGIQYGIGWNAVNPASMTGLAAAICNTATTNGDNNEASFALQFEGA